LSFNPGENIQLRSPATAPEMLASEVTPGLQQEQSPTPISLMSRFVYKMDDQMEVNSGQHRFNSETRPGMHGRVRS
jgi:hypothetical protein